MTPQKISATELRAHVRQIMQRARFQDETFLVENFGQPMAVIVSVQEYERLTRQRLTAARDDPAASLQVETEQA